MVEVSFSFHKVSINNFNAVSEERWLNSCLAYFGKDQACLDFVFVDDDFLLEMNRAHLNHDFYTDIITFDYNEGNSLNGEMYISIDRVKDNANNFGNGSFDEELSRVLIHGVLHLLGFKDDTEEAELEMRKLEDLCLSMK